ncbi:cysteine-rich KTR domain-containing protein [Sediminibacillus halophilus]|uniref:cysteine-rich KTR domain-containing protein n=1 Tax=Sediminibacillus halophilus TaxID=482461 RepID=UPI001113E166
MLCPVCNKKTQVKIGIDTVLENFPIFCPTFKQETIFNVKQIIYQLFKSQTLRRRADNRESNQLSALYLYSM